MSIESSFNQRRPVDGRSWLLAQGKTQRHLQVVPNEHDAFTAAKPFRTAAELFNATIEQEMPQTTTVESVPTLPDLEDNEPFILIQTARGFKAKEITTQLHTQRGISLKSIYKKYGVDNPTQMVSLAIMHGVLTAENFKNRDGEEDFDFSRIDELSERQINILCELTTTDSENSNEAIGSKLNISKANVNNSLVRLYADFELQTRPQAAAFYLLAEKQGLIKNTTTDLHQSSMQE